MTNLGEIYAIGTALCWVGTAVMFTAAGERIGSMVVNFLRMVMALAMLLVVNQVTRGMAVPLDATAHAWTWLSVSGLIGFTFGDLCLFRAFLLIGPRLGTLLMSFAPPLTAAIGYAFLGERLGPWQLLGMGLTLAGVVWAVLDRSPTPTTDVTPAQRRQGLVLGFCGALGQAVGLVLSKYGMGDFDALAANVIRVNAGMLGFGLLFFIIGWWPRVREGLRNRRALAFTAGGAFAGPFLGVTLSLLSVQNTEAGVAASIMGTTPVLIIPYAVFVGGERVSLGGILGALVAVGGVALLFLAPS
ncbi:MAG: DMT family transporter [Myxococcota bacterium]